ncbi:MAG TPA: glycosyltransferase family 87 protein [Rhizomicrobium sp.]|nr:glycosyltransferase family 87 protein [Rhizomicrobium sp.]
MRPLLSLLKSGDYLTPARARLWGGALIVALALTVVFLAATARGEGGYAPSDYAGRPLGTDFSNVYAAGRAALAGDAAAPFDIVRQGAMERAIFGPHTQLYGWHYPPVFLLLAAPLAMLPYLPALALWLAATLALYLLSIRLLLAGAPDLARGRSWLFVALGFTAVFVNFIHGQNGFLTAALFAFGLALLDKRPLLAGIAFGLLCYKPQYFAVIPLVLLASGRWRVLGAAAATALAVSAAATWLFGIEVWAAFFASAHFTRTVVLEQGNTGFAKMQSVFAAVRLMGGGVALAYAAQALSALIALVAAWRIWRGDAAREFKGAALCLAALLVTPYSMDYDLMALAPAIALLVVQGRARGFAAWEISALTLLWALPGLARTIAQHFGLPLMAPAMALALALVWRGAAAKRDARREGAMNSAAW